MPSIDMPATHLSASIDRTPHTILSVDASRAAWSGVWMLIIL
jgi:hypothetical protein